MRRYLVTWEIDIVDALSPRDAARQAFDIMRRPDTTATCFKVIEHDSGGDAASVDLLDDEDEPTAG
jgi:hypothetical protein